MTRRRTGFILLILGAVSTLAFSQGGATLEVKFYIPAGSVPTTTRVELISGEGMPIAQAMVDGSGIVSFGNLRDGNYNINVSGPDVQSASYQLRIMPSELSHVEVFQLRPTSNASAANNRTSQSAVSALDLGAPPEARKEVEKASQALKGQNWAEARKHCEKAIEIYPQFVSAYNELGVILIRLGERDKAREVLQKAIGLDRNYLRPYINLARMDAADRKYDEAETLLNKAVSNDPQNVEALFLLANAQFENGHYDEAIANARKVHAFPHHGFEAAHFICAAALQAEHRPDEAAEEYRVFLREAPDSKMAPNARAALQSLGAK
jgi:tetratricopeptide (TPR) repeat protein